MNKNGIIRIIEASIAILIVASVLFVSYNKNVVESLPDYSENARDILEELSKDVSMRGKVLNEENIDSFVDEKLPAHLNFEVNVCGIEAACGISLLPQGDVFSAERIISTNVDSNSFEPKKIRLFLWEEQ